MKKSLLLAGWLLVLQATLAGQNLKRGAVQQPAEAPTHALSALFRAAGLRAMYSVMDMEPSCTDFCYSLQLVAAQHDLREAEISVTNGDERALARRLHTLLEMRRLGRSKSLADIDKSTQQVGAILDELSDKLHDPMTADLPR